MANRSAAHTALVKSTLLALANAGYTAWENPTGVWFEWNKDGSRGRPHKFGKVGSGDIICILPPHGRHAEFEAKTGDAVQKKEQRDHQEYVVERNGGLYIVFHSVEELFERLKGI